MRNFLPPKPSLDAAFPLLGRTAAAISTNLAATGRTLDFPGFFLPERRWSECHGDVQAFARKKQPKLPFIFVKAY